MFLPCEPTGSLYVMIGDPEVGWRGRGGKAIFMRWHFITCLLVTVRTFAGKHKVMTGSHMHLKSSVLAHPFEV